MPIQAGGQYVRRCLSVHTAMETKLEVCFFFVVCFCLAQALIPPSTPVDFGDRRNETGSRSYLLCGM
ncbi:hypothetical protein LX36DRAFT_418351 [Colletotrichum falcatum]|nr:hypothetical protein LX36DRAFT_418351 [Colletotrichum falcatum]